MEFVKLSILLPENTRVIMLAENNEILEQGDLESKK